MWNNENCRQEVDNECPYCHEHLYMNKRVFANHVRWCKCNPKYEEIKKSTIEKLKNTAAQQKSLHTKKYNLICEICGKEYSLELSDHLYNSGKYKKTCCDKCAKQLTTLHTNIDELRNKLKSFYKNKRITKSNNINRNDIISINNLGDKILYTKKCEYCGNNFETVKINQKTCCLSHGHKLAIRNRYINELIRCNDLESIKILQKIYHKQCDFKFALNEYPKEFNFKLIEEFGWYKALNHGNNLNGVSRDHIFAVMDGYSKLIDPYLISHPANCRLLQHCENISKYNKSDINLEELIERVKNWNNKYGIYPNKISYDILEKFGIQVNKFNI